MDLKSVELDSKNGLLLGLAWINENLHEFAIPNVKSSSFTNEEIVLLKPASELALTVCLLKRCKIDIPVLDRLADWLWTQASFGSTFSHILIARNDFLPACAFYSSLYQLGYRSKVLSSILKTLAISDFSKFLPIQPWAQLAIEYNLWKLRLIPFKEIRQNNLYVTGLPEPWVISNEIAYAITHEIFYLSDFGFRKLKIRHLKDYLLLWIPYWTNTFISEHDNDLTSEFSMIYSSIQGEEHDISKHPLIGLFIQQQSNGLVKGPEGAGSYLFNKGDTENRRNFLSNYHTTLVFIMANALFLRNSNKITKSKLLRA
ncbi:DUF6895 family protein [Mucilaginibacter sp. X5P1]|uniref:DUF6895 family protein n=1 Tax=Mucilaginibacter sp. X5P1 TaxID=2723088 RepID=UPI00161E04E0|nr:hypothetical protein [Mucilaginibacter sp. X5P1]MBB6141730.1 hypothetical protein [Mucilaginibacter sp. X5P1]